MKPILASLALVLPFAAFATDNPDASFYKHAAEGGMAEVQLGNLAQSKSDNAAVKDFGAMMVKDHSAANDKLKSLAESKNIALPKGIGMEQRATKARLDVLRGEAFDKSYIKDMVQDHEADIAEFTKEAQRGQDPDAKAYAAATLPTLQKHLEKIKSIASDAHVNVD